jgi:hypothetical protein
MSDSLPLVDGGPPGAARGNGTSLAGTPCGGNPCRQADNCITTAGASQILGAKPPVEVTVETRHWRKHGIEIQPVVDSVLVMCLRLRDDDVRVLIYRQREEPAVLAESLPLDATPDQIRDLAIELYDRVARSQLSFGDT